MIDKNSSHSPDFQLGETILIDKRMRQTSFSVVKQLRYLIKRKYNYSKFKIGHAGTLDPLATGLLILCTGKSTKTIEQIQNGDKEYIAEIMLGATTPSYDAETEVSQLFPYDHVNEELVRKVLTTFEGEIDQVPPNYSAMRINGVRAYQQARKGKDFVLKSRKITIHEIELLELDLPVIKIRVKCSKGTYIRTLAKDIGEKLNSGAYMSGLRRTAIKEFKIEDALTIPEFENKLNAL